MNYYEHHIGDYATATKHLTWDEDMAYTRLIRLYYEKERPIPADLKQACRLVCASSKAQRDAVATVLEEFFVLREDGWHQDVCDENISKYLEGEPEREAKKANEENRLKRHRAERANLFKTLTDAGGHAPWNIGIVELRTMVEALQAPKPETDLNEPATAPATPATATQYPLPITQCKTSPHTPKGGKAEPETKPGKPKRSAIGLPSYLQACRQSGIKPIPEGDAVFGYAEGVGIPLEFLRLHWLEFKARYSDPDAKRYKDWAAVHRKSVRGNWFKLWYFAPDGSCALTTVGEQARRSHGEAA